MTPILFAWLAVLSVNVAPPFHLVGEQSFLLKGVADVTQSIYVVASDSGDVERLVWIQHERLRKRSGAGYDYSADEQTRIHDLPFAVNVGRYASSPPDSSSDRAKVYELLHAHGLRMPLSATRVRMVYVPPDDPYSEVMVIYAERGAPDRAEIVERAKAAFTMK